MKSWTKALMICGLTSALSLGLAGCSAFSSMGGRLDAASSRAVNLDGHTDGVSQLQTCGADVVDKPDVDAAPALSACILADLAAGAKTIELPVGHYYIASPVQLDNVQNLTIQTQGVTSGPACLSSGAAECAVLIAVPTYNDSIFLSTNASSLVLNHVALDGNIGPRRAHYSAGGWGPNGGYNARIHACSSCQFLGFTSTRAPSGTGLEYSGDNALFDTVNFFENGWGATSYTQGWSDGLTVASSANIIIRNSRFFNNSDVNLILGHAPNAVIQNNVIGGSNNFSFAGLMLDNFNGTTPGDFTNAKISGNQIDCGNGYCGIGLMLGPHFWYASIPIIGTGAIISNNSISGAKQGVYTSGANGFSLDQNVIDTEGAYAGVDFGGCLAQPQSISNGDSLSITNSNYGLYSVGLTGCGPQDLPGLVIELPSISYDVALSYKNVLGRWPDLAGGQSFTASGESMPQLLNALATSPEGQSKINAAFQNVLGRDADPSGLTNYTKALASGSMTLDQLRVDLMLSAEALSQPYRRP